MKKIMFLTLVLSFVAMGSASAVENERLPLGLHFGVGGDNGFVMVSVGDRDHGPKYHKGHRPKDRECCNPRHHKHNHKHHGHKHHGHKHYKPNGKHKDYGPGHHGRPGRPTPPPRRR